jgi:PIN like domain
MKDGFPEWFPKTPDELAEIWARAIFVPDTNILLHCVRHPAPVREELLRVFEVLRDSLWIPHQVGLEFHRNRLEVEYGAQDAYDRLIKDHEAALGQVKEKLRQLRAHPTIDVEREVAALDRFLEDFRGRMATARDGHPTNDIAVAVARLTALLNGRVGMRWKADRLAALKKEGEERYARKTPPGYKDSKKDAGEFDKYGDLIIWKDLIEKAKAEKRPVVFISDDAKEDWWWIHRGRKLGARPELLEEFRVAAEQDFHIYEFPQFLRIAAERNPEIRSGVDQIEKSLLSDELARKRMTDVAGTKALREQVIRLEDERDAIISALSGAPSLEANKAPPNKTDLRERLRLVDSELVEATERLRSEEILSED